MVNYKNNYNEESPLKYINPTVYEMAHNFFNNYKSSTLKNMSYILLILATIFCLWSIKVSLFNELSAEQILLQNNIITQSEAQRIKIYAKQNNLNSDKIFQRVILNGQFIIINSLSRKLAIVEDTFTNNLYYAVWDNHHWYISAPVYGKDGKILNHDSIKNHFHIYAIHNNITDENINESFLTTITRKLSLYLN